MASLVLLAGTSMADDLSGQLEVLDLAQANGGTNPVTGVAWKVGDTYRLIFVTSIGTNGTSTNIADYNVFVNDVAASSTNHSLLGNAQWFAVGSTAAVDARDNTSTNPSEDGAGVPIFLTDGISKVVNGNATLWGGTKDNAVQLDENAQLVSGDVMTGSDADGTGRNAGEPGDRVLGGSSEAPPKITVGVASRLDGTWMVNYNTSATSTRPFYAMSEILEVVRPAGTVIILH